MKYFLTLILVPFFCSISVGQKLFEPLIGDLRPLVSTKEDVEKRFGRESLIIGNQHRYKNELATIEVVYPNGCQWEKSGERIDSGIIRDISFFSKEPIYLDQLGYDLSTFAKSQPDADMPTVVSYSNRKIGIAFNVDTNANRELGGTVGPITLFLPFEPAYRCADEA